VKPGKLHQPLVLNLPHEKDEAMATLTETSPVRNPKAYHCTYLGLAGILTKPADQVLFLEPESGAVVTLTPAEVLRDVVVNGEVAGSMQQYLADMAVGGYAKTACARRMEVA
jgi:hypothetical protein